MATNEDGPPALSGAHEQGGSSWAVTVKVKSLRRDGVQYHQPVGDHRRRRCSFDTLGVEIEASPQDWGQVARLRVNGRDLIELVTAFERDFADDLAGRYQPLYTDALPPARHLFGEASPALSQEEDGRVPVLGCICGTPECWPLVARISVGAHEVRWHEFGQPWRPGWSYQGFGPFVFRREQYEAALRIGG